jgi:hypothetical protein
VGLEGGQRLQLVPPFPWPSDELEVNLTHGALSDLELKLSIKCNDFRCMVPNNFCSISKKKCSPARDSLCPLYSRVTRRGRLDAKLEGSNPVPHPMETWGRVWSTPVPPLDGNRP